MRHTPVLVISVHLFQRHIKMLTGEAVSRLGAVLRVAVNVQEGDGLKAKVHKI